MKKIFLALMIALTILSATPSTGRCGHFHHGGGPFWGLTGLVLGTALTATLFRPPPPQPVVYAEAAPPVYEPPVYTTPPSVPPGMCRWERYVLDGYGRTVLDPNGQPVREYTIGPCDR